MTICPLLLLDVGFQCTGVAVATLHDDGPHVALDLIVPERGMSTKALREKRACVKFGDLAERLYLGFHRLANCIYGDGDHPNHVVAEIPVMGSRSAAGMRSMAMALACYRGAFAGSRERCHDFTRNDVLAACFPTKKPTGDGKAATRDLVLRTFTIDGGKLPKEDSAAARKLNDNAYDAAALLFVAREHGILARCGWGDWAPVKESV